MNHPTTAISVELQHISVAPKVKLIFQYSRNQPTNCSTFYLTLITILNFSVLAVEFLENRFRK